MGEMLGMASILELLLKAFSLGFDSFLAGIAIGPIILSWRARAWYVVMFGVCDGVATLLGAALPHRLPEPQSAALYLVGVVLIIQGARRSRAWLFVMPFLFSLDNLAAGGSAAEAPALALSSAAMAAAGLALSALGRQAVMTLTAPRTLT
jgi:putative Mn2+ efflux pump MntP